MNHRMFGRYVRGKMNLDVEDCLRCFMAQLLSIVVLLFTGQHAFAGSESSLKLEGTLRVDSCASLNGGCISAAKAIYDYSLSAKLDPSVYGIYMQASPWRLYNGDMRIITIEEVAKGVKPKLGDNFRRIELIASWSGVAPGPNVKSLAQKLSDALDGFPVRGMDGFVWLTKDGVSRTTRQAFTVKRIKYPYWVHPGDEVMVSVQAGSWIDFEEDYVKKGDADGIMHAAAGWDIFGLLPDRALQSFEAAARLSNAIAAYNAALIRLDRGKEGDLEAATALLSQAAALGDKMAKEQLQKLKPQGR